MSVELIKIIKNFAVCLNIFNVSTIFTFFSFIATRHRTVMFDLKAFWHKLMDLKGVTTVSSSKYKCAYSKYGNGLKYT